MGKGMRHEDAGILEHSSSLNAFLVCSKSLPLFFFPLFLFLGGLVDVCTLYVQKLLCVLCFKSLDCSISGSKEEERTNRITFYFTRLANCSPCDFALTFAFCTLFCSFAV